MRPRIGALVAVVFVVSSLVWGIAAPSDRRSIAGTVQDAAGAVMSGVTVEASGPMVVTAATDARGGFRINNLLPGDYTVTASLHGQSLPGHKVHVTDSGHAHSVFVFPSQG